MENIIDPDLDKGNTKLWGMVKRLKRNTVNCKLFSDMYEKDKASNNQFKSLFSPAIHESLPDMGPSHFPSMNKLKNSVPGILKQLQNLKIQKALCTSM